MTRNDTSLHVTTPSGTRLASVVATHEEIHLATSFDYPPVPWRFDDWSAIDANNYDADWHGEEVGFISSSPHGHGETEQEAIEDLLDQIEGCAAHHKAMVARISVRPYLAG